MAKKKMVHTRTYIYIKFEDFCLLIWGLFVTYLEVKNSYHAVSELQGALKGLCLSLYLWMLNALTSASRLDACICGIWPLDGAFPFLSEPAALTMAPHHVSSSELYHHFILFFLT